MSELNLPPPQPLFDRVLQAPRTAVQSEIIVDNRTDVFIDQILVSAFAGAMQIVTAEPQKVTRERCDFIPNLFRIQTSEEVRIGLTIRFETFVVQSSQTDIAGENGSEGWTQTVFLVIPNNI